MSPSDDARYGFRIVGNCAEARRLVDWAAAFRAHCECDPQAEVEHEAYLSAFTFAPEFAAHLTATGSTAAYAGRCGAAWLWFDIDAGDDLERATADARRLCAGLAERYALDGDELLAFYSGAKGFHIGLPMALVGSLQPTENFHAIAKRFALDVADRLAVSIDAGVYDRVRAFRAPNSRHGKTGLHKRRLSFDELLGLRLDAILDLARTPVAFDIPDPPASNSQAASDWQAASAAVEAATIATAERRTAKQGATLNRATREFLRDGAACGDRHRLLFSAAANLAEFGCPAALAHALLTEAALDSGLTPSETRRQIECGINYQQPSIGAALGSDKGGP
jgi:hypothetical protein